jgi:hypothetical protein
LSWRCHSMALRRSSTTRDFLSTLGGFGCPRGAGAVLTTSLADTRRVRAPRLPFTKAPLGRRGLSRRFVRGRRPQGRNCGQPGRGGRSGTRPPVRPTPGGFANCYIWGAFEKIDLTACWLTHFSLPSNIPMCNTRTIRSQS